MMVLHTEAWQCSYQNRVGDCQKTECHMGSLIDYESQKIKKVVLSSGRIVLLYEAFWFMSVSR